MNEDKLNSVVGQKLCRFAVENGFPLPPGIEKGKRANEFIRTDEERNLAYEMRLYQLMLQAETAKKLSYINGWIFFFGILAIIGIFAAFIIVPQILDDLRFLRF